MRFEELKFVVMDKLLQKAGELDEELKLHKTSKEAKRATMRLDDDSKKSKKGQLRWQDPW